MTHAPQIKVPATYMRGGTSKGVFFRLKDLPEAAQVPGKARDNLLLRICHQRWFRRSRAHSGKRYCHGSHLAGQHPENHRCPHSHHQW